MSRNVADLGVLSRAGLTTTAGASDRAAPPQGGERPAGREAVPRPRPRWRTRVLLPAALLGATAGLLAYAARDALMPATPVRVVPVVVRAVQGAAAPGGDAPGAAADGSGGVGGGAGSGATVQAPGWVEPDPFAFTVSALTDGVVKAVLVVEGQAVEAGQVVLRMVDDDAKLALARAEADVAMREGEIGVAKATLEAARRDWDHPVERTRAVESAEAMLAEAKAELDRLPVEVEAERARADEMADAARRAESNVARRAVAESELVQTRLRLKAQVALVKSTAAKRPVLVAKVRQREAELTAAKDAAKLRRAERKALDEATAALRQAEAAWRQSCAMCAEARLRLERMEVKAPSAGVVMVRLVEPGSKLMLASDDMRSAQAVRLYDPKKLQVRVDVPIADAAQVGVGQAAKVV